MVTVLYVLIIILCAMCVDAGDRCVTDSNMDKFQIPKLKGKSDWTIWKLQIESNLQYHEYEGILTGRIKESDPLRINKRKNTRQVLSCTRKLMVLLLLFLVQQLMMNRCS